MSMGSVGDSMQERVRHARHIHEAGDLATALRLYNELLKEAPKSATILHYLGVALAQTGRLAEADIRLKSALDLEPNNPNLLFDLGALRDAQGRPQDALQMLRRVVEVSPDRIDAWQGIGMYEYDRGQYPAAAEAYLNAYRLAPGRVDLALEAAKYSSPDAGIEIIADCLDLHPEEEALLLPLSELLIRAGRLEEAEESLKILKGRRPKAGILARHLGQVYYNQRRYPEAAAALYEAVSNDAYDPESWILMARLRETIGDADGAIAALNCALEMKPEDLVLASQRARLHQHACRAEEGQRTLERLPKAARSTAQVRMLSAMLLPTILESNEQIDQLRARWLEIMEDVAAKPTFNPEPWDTIGMTAFFLGYHGREDRPLMEAYARATLASSPNLVYTARNLGSNGKKIRIGFVSAHLCNHSVGRMLNKVMGGLNRDRFEVILFQIPNMRAIGVEMGEREADRTVHLINQLDLSRKAIEDELLDVLVYPDLHLDPYCEALTYSRLAPIQATTWGHPGTGGRSTIDYWISCEDWDPAGNERLYSESLVRLKHPLFVYEPPTPPKEFRALSYYGLKKDRRRYGCLQSLFKLHPDFDAFLAEILDSDPKAEIVLTMGAHYSWHREVRNRLAKSLDVNRVRFIPRVPNREYLSAFNASDVLLDPIHFAGANTTLEAFSIGKPVVTMEGDQLRNRETGGFYRQIGYEKLVSKDRTSYVENAVRLAQDRDFYREAHEAIMSGHGELYMNPAPVREFEAWLASVCRK